MIDYSVLTFSKGKPRAVAKLEKQRRLTQDERLVYAEVDRRDGRRCRFPRCRRRTAHHHHVVYRSQGGRTITRNVLSLCVQHHGWVHGGLVTVEGNANRHPCTQAEQTRWVATESGRDAKIQIRY